MAKTTQELIDLIDVQIEALITTPQVDYRIGEKSVSAGQKITQLREMRAALLKTPSGDFKAISFDSQINEFGTDNTQRM